MQDDLDSKAAGLTHFIFKVPSYKRLMVLIILVSFFGGFLLHSVFSISGPQSFTDAFFYGGPDGVLLFALPAVAAAILATSLLSLSSFRQAFKYFLFIAFISMSLILLVYLMGLAAYSRLSDSVPGGPTEIFLLSSAMVMVVWLVSLRVPLNYPWSKSLAVSLLHPMSQISFLVLWRAYSLLQMEIRSPVVFAIQFAVAAGILLLALWSLMVLINAPAKRNFGISAVQASALFFAQWVKGGKGLEEILAEVGTLIESEVGVAGFRRKDGSLKASFVVPLVHYGPVGNLGGSEYPILISDDLAKRSGGLSFVFHGTVTHDFNPVFSSSHQHISQTAAALLSDRSGYSSKASLWLSREGRTKLLLLGVGAKPAAFTAITRAPFNTDDIDLPLGFSIRNLVVSRGFRESLVVDMHNSKADDCDMTTGSRAYYELEDSIRALVPGKAGALKLGVAYDPLSGFTAQQGIGRAGLKVAVVCAGERRGCIILFDANNALPAFRSHMMESLESFKFDFVDIFTTDSHAVNTISGVHNPLGLNVSSHALLPYVKSAVKRALRDVEPVSAKVSSARIKLHVLGENRTSELVSTINAIVAVLRIIAPVILALSLVLAFVSVIFLGRLIV